MQIEGYEEHAPDEPYWEVQVYLSKDVLAFFDNEGRKGNRNEPHVKKAKGILTKLKRFGLDHVRGSYQFKREGRFPSGKKSGGDQAVDEVKSDQVRVYGGAVSFRGMTAFYFVEATAKKDNKADQDQLKRVAKALGEISERLDKQK